MPITLDHRPDTRDHQIIERRRQSYESLPDGKPRVGEHVRMLDGSMQRISHIWDWGDDNEFPPSAQTSEGGSWYFGDGYASFSGSLNPCIPFTSLRFTGGRQGGEFWIFHHDHWQAHNGVTFTIPVRVWEVIEN